MCMHVGLLKMLYRVLENMNKNFSYINISKNILRDMHVLLGKHIKKLEVFYQENVNQTDVLREMHVLQFVTTQ
jgi:hypothetical protein